MKRLILILAALAQIAVIGWMIGRHEYTLAHGTPVKFIAAPTDPEDPFRGRYVALRLETDYTTSTELALPYGSRPWASLELDADGYARITNLSAGKPAGKLALHVKSFWSGWDHEEKEDGKEPTRTCIYHCTFDFDRYYMNEKAAPEAEIRYRELTRRTNDQSDETTRRKNYLLVRILNNEGVAEELYLDNQPVEELLAGSR